MKTFHLIMGYLKFEQKYLHADRPQPIFASRGQYYTLYLKKNLEDFIYSKNISQCLSIAASELRAKQTVSQNSDAGN